MTLLISRDSSAEAFLRRDLRVDGIGDELLLLVGVDTHRELDNSSASPSSSEESMDVKLPELSFRMGKLGAQSSSENSSNFLVDVLDSQEEAKDIDKEVRRGPKQGKLALSPTSVISDTPVSATRF